MILSWSVPTDQPVFTDFFVPFIGSIPESLGQLKNLKELSLFSNKLSGRDSHVLKRSVPTDHLKYTIFLPPFAAGTIPESLGKLVSLGTLNLQRNKLEGQFPPFFGMVSAV